MGTVERVAIVETAINYTSTHPRVRVARMLEYRGVGVHVVPDNNSLPTSQIEYTLNGFKIMSKILNSDGFKKIGRSKRPLCDCSIGELVDIFVRKFQGA